MRKKYSFEAYLDDYGVISVYISMNFYNGESKKFYLKDEQNHLIPLRISYLESQNDYRKYTLVFEPSSVEIGKKYTILEEHGLGTILQYGLVVRSDEFDENFYNPRSDFGASVADNQTRFVLWAPTAISVVLKLNTPQGLQFFSMAKVEKGAWETTLDFDCHGLLYTYLVEVNGQINEVCDPYGYSSDADGKRSCVIDFNRLNQEFHDDKLKPLHHYTNAQILEVSVRDFSMDKEASFVNRGRFLGMVEENVKTSEGYPAGFDYVKQLNPTHIQIMPVYDFVTVDEENPSLFYNWGYDPLQYNTLEGSYSTNPKDPLCRVNEFMEVIKKYHEAGIRVNLDVVYNHMYDLETSYFEKIVPYYYFRYGKNGQISNGSFCGNDVDSSNRMVRHFILQSCLHFVQHYHVDGFRFDLMGILDIETINKVYHQGVQYREGFMVYGEGWNMPTLLDEQFRAHMYNADKMPNIAFFNDFYRDHVKGPSAADMVWAKGYTLGDTNYLNAFKSSLMGTALSNYDVCIFNSPTQSVNYVACHDNMTLWDKIKEACKNESKAQRIARQKLTIGAQCLSQGILFLHFGQEACRSKNGLDNTYRSNDEINKINYERSVQYQEVVKYTRDLMHFRRHHECFRLANSFDIASRVVFHDLEYGCLLMSVRDKETVYHCFFNPTHESVRYDLNGVGELILDNNGYTDKVEISSVHLSPISLVVVAQKV